MPLAEQYSWILLYRYWFRPKPPTKKTICPALDSGLRSCGARAAAYLGLAEAGFHHSRHLAVDELEGAIDTRVENLLHLLAAEAVSEEAVKGSRLDVLGHVQTAVVDVKALIVYNSALARNANGHRFIRA